MAYKLTRHLYYLGIIVTFILVIMVNSYNPTPQNIPTPTTHYQRFIVQPSLSTYSNSQQPHSYYLVANSTPTTTTPPPPQQTGSTAGSVLNTLSTLITGQSATGGCSLVNPGSCVSSIVSAVISKVGPYVTNAALTGAGAFMTFLASGLQGFLNSLTVGVINMFNSATSSYVVNLCAITNTCSNAAISFTGTSFTNALFTSSPYAGAVDGATLFLFLFIVFGLIANAITMRVGQMVLRGIIYPLSIFIILAGLPYLVQGFSNLTNDAGTTLFTASGFGSSGCGNASTSMPSYTYGPNGVTESTSSLPICSGTPGTALCDVDTILNSMEPASYIQPVNCGTNVQVANMSYNLAQQQQLGSQSTSTTFYVSIFHIVLALGMIVGAFALFLELALRQLVVYLLMVLIPFAVVAATLKQGEQVLKRMLELLIATILSIIVIDALYVIGANLIIHMLKTTAVGNSISFTSFLGVFIEVIATLFLASIGLPIAIGIARIESHQLSGAGGRFVNRGGRSAKSHVQNLSRQHAAITKTTTNDGTPPSNRIAPTSESTGGYSQSNNPSSVNTTNIPPPPPSE